MNWLHRLFRLPPPVHDPVADGLLVTFNQRRATERAVKDELSAIMKPSDYEGPIRRRKDWERS